VIRARCAELQLGSLSPFAELELDAPGIDPIQRQRIFHIKNENARHVGLSGATGG
jgi:hypothetical protein